MPTSRLGSRRAIAMSITDSDETLMASNTRTARVDGPEDLALEIDRSGRSTAQ